MSALWTPPISFLLRQYIACSSEYWDGCSSAYPILKNLPPCLNTFAFQSCHPWDLTTGFLNQSKLTLLRSSNCTLPLFFLIALGILNSTISWSLLPRLPLITTSSTHPSLLVNSSRSSCESPQLALPIPVSRSYPCHPPEMFFDCLSWFQLG